MPPLHLSIAEEAATCSHTQCSLGLVLPSLFSYLQNGKIALHVAQVPPASLPPQLSLL